LEEIKTQNKKLRQAITTLTVGFEEERKKQEAAFKADTSKDKKIADLQRKLEEMDFLLEEIEQKEEERAEMEKRLEEIVEYENMVEEMVSEIAKKDDIIEEITAKFGVVQEEYRLMEDLNNQFE
jgi:chromosome segregation ATPase